MSAEGITFNFLDPILPSIHGEITQDQLIHMHKIIFSYPPINYHELQQLTTPKRNIVYPTIKPRRLPSA